jgi:hypothetical protein
MNSLESYLDQLHDIDGLDAISWWPLAIGWWMLIAVFLLAAAGFAYFLYSRFTFERSWKKDAFQKLDRLEKQLSEGTARDVLMTLSEYLRRIVLRRFPRKECAGLTGEEWLKWLTVHDPHHFEWEKQGILFMEVPYAPCTTQPSVQQVQDLIQAVKRWVR